MRGPISRYAAGLAWLGLAAQASAEDVCREVAREIDRRILETDAPGELIALGGHISERSLEPLLRLGQARSDPDAVIASYLAIGLSRHAAALRMLRAAPPRFERAHQLGHALALFALGEGSATASIALVLARGVAADRRRVAEALALMPQARPRIMLHEALSDADEQVRLAAAALEVKLGNRRARKTALQLLGSASPEVVERTARVLLSSRLEPAPLEDLPRFPPDLRAQGMVRWALRLERPPRSVLRPRVLSSDPVERAGAIAALVASRGVDANELLGLARAIGVKHGAVAEAAVSAGLALLGRSELYDAISGADAVLGKEIARVLGALAGARGLYTELAPEDARSVGRAVASWVERGMVDDQDVGKSIEGLAAIDPAAALFAARARLEGTEGPGLVPALRVIAQHGGPLDLAAVVRVAREEHGPVRTEAWIAAARVCSR